MEKLFVYAILLYNDFEVEKEYQNTLDNMFIDNSTDDILLELEYLSSDIKKAVRYIRTHIDYSNFNNDGFGKFLMEKLKEYYNIMDIKTFADKMYSLWYNIPPHLQTEEPFHTLSYADEPLLWGDEKQTRELYENILNYYNK